MSDETFALSFDQLESFAWVIDMIQENRERYGEEAATSFIEVAERVVRDKLRELDEEDASWEETF